MTSGTRPTTEPPEIPGYASGPRIAYGGFSDVFKYQQRTLKRAVAVKVLINSALGGAAESQFAREGELLARVHSPYVVQVIDSGRATDHRPYLVMELCDGDDLRTRIERRGPLSLREALRVGVRVATALEIAHRQGIIHRGVKPANILTTTDGTPKLTDFGIADAADSGRRPEGHSVPWASREALDEDVTDERSDVWSLGATVYQLLTGRPPFSYPGRSNRSADMQVRIFNDALPPTGLLTVPDSLERVLRTTMAKDPAKRFQSALEVARALQGVELELSYAITPFEGFHSNAARDGEEAAEPPIRDEGDRGVEVTTARHVHLREGAEPAGATFPEGTTRRARPREVVSARMIPAPERRVTIDAEPAEDHLPSTVLRDRAAPADAPEPAVDEPAAPEKAHSRALVLVAAAMALVVLAAGGFVLARRGPDTPGGAGATKGVDEVQPPVVTAVVPEPTGLTAVRRGTEVVFTWNRSTAKDVTWLWDRADVTTTTTSHTDTPSVTLHRVPKGQRPCLEVSARASDGRTSEPVRRCLAQ